MSRPSGPAPGKLIPGAGTSDVMSRPSGPVPGKPIPEAGTFDVMRRPSGGGLPRLRPAVHAASGSCVLRDARQKQPQVPTPLLACGRQNHWPDLRPNGSTDGILPSATLPRAAATHPLPRPGDGHGAGVPRHPLWLACCNDREAFQSPLAGRALFQVGSGVKQHLRLKASHGASRNAVKTQIWIAITTGVLFAIRKKELGIEHSLYTMRQVLSVTLFEKTPLFQAFADSRCPLDHIE